MATCTHISGSEELDVTEGGGAEGSSLAASSSAGAASATAAGKPAAIGAAASSVGAAAPLDSAASPARHDSPSGACAFVVLLAASRVGCSGCACACGLWRRCASTAPWTSIARTCKHEEGVVRGVVMAWRGERWMACGGEGCVVESDGCVWVPPLLSPVIWWSALASCPRRCQSAALRRRCGGWRTAHRAHQQREPIAPPR